METTFLRHKVDGFIIEQISNVSIKKDSQWIVNLDLSIITGRVVFAGDSGWTVGEESDGFLSIDFEKADRYVVDIDEENSMWDVTDIVTNQNYFGWFHNNKIEWDSLIPDTYKEIETLILKHL